VTVLYPPLFRFPSLNYTLPCFQLIPFIHLKFAHVASSYWLIPLALQFLPSVSLTLLFPALSLAYLSWHFNPFHLLSERCDVSASYWSISLALHIIQLILLKLQCFRLYHWLLSLVLHPPDFCDENCTLLWLVIGCYSLQPLQAAHYLECFCFHLFIPTLSDNNNNNDHDCC